jgi:hypothetical protein
MDSFALQFKFCTVRDHGHTRTNKFYFNLYCLTALLNMMMIRNFQVMLGQMLNHFV